MKGHAQEGVLYKSKRQTQKFWKYKGYGINTADLANVTDIVIETEYDGKLHTTVSNLRENGIAHHFKDEKQLILPVEHWGKAN